MSSGEDTRKKRDNAQEEHEEEKPKKTTKVSGEAIGSSRGVGTIRRHQHQLRNSPLEQRSTTTVCQFGATKDDDQPTSSSASFATNKPKLESVNSVASGETSPEKRPAVSAVPASSSESSSSLLNKKPKRKIWDMESALLNVVQASGVAEKEYLTSNKDCWITFRMAHAGDAAPIANWYRQQQDRMALDKAAEEEDDKPEIVVRPSSPPAAAATEANVEEEQTPASSLLEHWLSEGLGDEDTCPSVYGLMAYVHSTESTTGISNDDRMAKVEEAKHSDLNDTPDKGNDANSKTTTTQPTSPVSRHSKLAAVVLLTIAWSSGERNLRIEWMSIDHPKGMPSKESVAVQQKVWLRLASLSVMTACQLMAIDNEILKAQTDAVNKLNAATSVIGSKLEGTKHPSSKRLLPSAE